MAAAKKMLQLKSSDGETFRVEEEVAMKSQMIVGLSQMIVGLSEDGLTKTEIPISNVTGKILSKAIEYCSAHIRDDDGGEALKAWDAEFIEDVDSDTLCDLMMAADYLDIKGLMNLAMERTKSILKGKTPEEIRKILNIENDFTPEEEAEISKETKLVFKSSK